MMARLGRWGLRIMGWIIGLGRLRRCSMAYYILHRQIDALYFILRDSVKALSDQGMSEKQCVW